MRCSGPVIVSGGEEEEGEREEGRGRPRPQPRAAAGWASLLRQRKGAGARRRGKRGSPARASPSLLLTPPSAGRDLILPPRLQASQDLNAVRIKGMRHRWLREAQNAPSHPRGAGEMTSEIPANLKPLHLKERKKKKKASLSHTRHLFLRTIFVLLCVPHRKLGRLREVSSK